MSYDSDSEWEKIENKHFELTKSLMVLAATIFGASVALAVGKQGNVRFIMGEFLLFISLSSGMIIMYSMIKGKEFFHFLMVNWELKSNLKKRTGGNEDLLIDYQEKQIKDYELLIEKSKGGFLSPLLKIIKIDHFYPIFLSSFLLGTFLIFFSLLDLDAVADMFCQKNNDLPMSSKAGTLTPLSQFKI